MMSKTAESRESCHLSLKPMQRGLSQVKAPLHVRGRGTLDSCEVCILNKGLFYPSQAEGLARRREHFCGLSPGGPSLGIHTKTEVVRLVMGCQAATIPFM